MSHFRGLHPTAHGDTHEREILLRPGPIEFHLVRLTDSARAHIADHPNDLGRRRLASHEKSFADWIFVSENFARAGLADQQHVGMALKVVFIKVASGKKGNAPGAQKTRHKVMRRPSAWLGACLQRTTSPRVKSRAETASEVKSPLAAALSKPGMALNAS